MGAADQLLKNEGGTAQRIQSTEEAHNVRWIHRARLSAHRLRAGTTEAHIRDAAIVRSKSAAISALSTLAGSHLRPAYSSTRCANPEQPITGHSELVAIWISRGSRQRTNAGQNSGQRSGIPDATIYQQTRGGCQATPDWTSSSAGSKQTRSRAMGRSVGYWSCWISAEEATVLRPFRRAATLAEQACEKPPINQVHSKEVSAIPPRSECLDARLPLDHPANLYPRSR